MAARLFSLRWTVEWGCLLSTVFLAGSTLNCLFQWLSHGRAWDLAGAIFSLVLTAVVYVTSFYRVKIASLQFRLMIAAGSLAIWAVFLPFVMRIAGLE